MWRETIKLRLAWSLLFILWGKFSAMVNHYAVEHDLQKYSRALCASVPLLYWKIMGLYPIKNCIKSLKYYMHFTGISLIRLFCMCRCWQHTEKGSSDWLLPFKSSSGAQDFFWIMKVCACMKNVQWKKKRDIFASKSPICKKFSLKAHHFKHKTRVHTQKKHINRKWKSFNLTVNISSFSI